MSKTKLHFEAHAAAWESMSRGDKSRLLACAPQCPPKWIVTAAEVRWHFLPTDVKAGLRNLLPAELVQRCSQDLKAREA